MSDLKIYCWAASVMTKDGTTHNTILSHCYSHSREEAHGTALAVIKDNYPNHKVPSEILIRHIPTDIDEDEDDTPKHEFEGTRVKSEFSLPKHF